MATNKTIKQLAKMIYDLEIDLENASSDEERQEIENKITMVTLPLMNSPLKMMQIDEEIQKMLTK